MKQVHLATLLAIALLIVACTKKENGVKIKNPSVPSYVGAIQTPTSTTSYSYEETSALVMQFENGNFHDITENQVPSEILTAFGRDFQNVHDIEWEVGLTNENIYNVEFEANRRDYEAFYENTGTLLMYVTEIWWSEVPQAVKNGVYERYSGYEVDDVDKITAGNTIIYQVDLEKGERELYVHFTENGVFISEGVDY